MTQALRIVHPDERPMPQEDAQQRLRDIMSISDWMFARGLASTRAQAMTYECEVHGIILPHAFANGYRRRECPCMWECRQAESVQRQQAAIRHTIGEKQTERCYTWLGKDAQEIGLETKTFGNFDYRMQPDAFKFCINYNPLEDPGNAVFIGNVGVGKTHLAAAICNGQRAKGIPCLWATAQNLFNALYAASFDGKLSIEEQFGSTKLMVLDDIGKLNLNEATGGKFQRKTLFAMLNRRYIRKLPTIITTNEPDSMEQCFDEATLDRLYEHCKLLEMHGESYRRVLAEQHKNGG